MKITIKHVNTVLELSLHDLNSKVCGPVVGTSNSTYNFDHLIGLGITHQVSNGKSRILLFQASGVGILEPKFLESGPTLNANPNANPP